MGFALMAPSLPGRIHFETAPNTDRAARPVHFLSALYTIGVGGGDTVCDLQADGATECQDAQQWSTSGSGKGNPIVRQRNKSVMCGSPDKEI